MGLNVNVVGAAKKGIRRSSTRVTSHDVAEHEGRVPQPGVPSGPRQTVAPLPSASAATKAKQVRRRAPRRPSPASTLKKVKRRQATRRNSLDFMHSTPAPHVTPSTRPKKLLGVPTAGDPTIADLGKAVAAGQLKVDKSGALTTPKVRQARKQVKQAKKIVRKSGSKALRGLSPEQREVAKLDREAHKRYPDVPVSVLMGDTEQESNFTPGETSSAGAGGLTQFIPSTAAEYGVEMGTGKHEKRTQVFGQAHLLSDSTKSTGSLKTALGDYYGDPSASYSSEVLEKAAAYKGLDKPPLSKGQRKKVQLANEAARAAGVKGIGQGAQLAGGKVGPAPKRLVTKVVAAEHAMREIDGDPYVLGGGHGNPHSEPTNGTEDCSGAVGYVLNKVGAMKGSATSGEMGRYLKPGPGALTVFYNAEHTFLRLINRKGEAEYWGTSVGDSGAGGLGRHPTPSKSYLAQYSVGHVPGMGKKQALQLGYTGSLTGGSAFPGMTLSSGGTTATVTSSVTKSGKPGFSKLPIKATPYQQAKRTLREIHSLGKGAEATPPAGTGQESTLTRLEKKYGKAAV